MKILIICEKFAPENTVGAIRMTKIAKYLKLNHQCEITVLTRERKEYNDIGDAKYIDHILYANENIIGKIIIYAYKKYSTSEWYDENKRDNCKLIISNHEKQISLLSKIIIYLKSILAILYSEYIPRSYCRNALKKLKKNNFDFDVVISSFGPSASHYIGKKIKEKKPEIIWIADYRDPLAIGESTKGFLHKWAIGFASRITGKANAISVASNGFIHCLNLCNNNNVHVIHNGYDKDDYKNIDYNNSPHERIRLVYTGTLFSGSRDISIIFHALKELIEENVIDKNKVEIIYAGPNKREFLFQYNNSQLGIHVEANDLIPKIDSLKLQNSADLLLISAWNTSEYQGSLPLKIYEYLYVRKPIICSICGNSSNSELKRIINYCHAGICYEAANHEKDYPELKKSLLYYYKEFCKNGYIEKIPEKRNKDAIDSFDYENITELFYSLIK